ncbi:hypothetical protein GCM10029992_11930 [Glycomyces albus]
MRGVLDSEVIEREFFGADSGFSPDRRPDREADASDAVCRPDLPRCDVDLRIPSCSPLSSDRSFWLRRTGSVFSDA